MLRFTLFAGVAILLSLLSVPVANSQLSDRVDGKRGLTTNIIRPDSEGSSVNPGSRSAGSSLDPAQPSRAAATGNTYYVDNTNAACSDAGSGLTPELPFCTITRGTNVATVGGDTVRVLAGTYAETVKPNSGVAGAPITVSAAPGVTVTGQAGNSTNGGAFRITLKSYIIIDGFNIINTADYGVILDTSNHITISNNHVSYSGTPAIHKIGIYLRATTDSVVIGNTIDHNTMDGIRLNLGSNNNIVTQNVSYGNAEGSVRNACGIDLINNSNNNTITYNIVYANEDTGLNFYSGSSFNLVYGNLTYGNGDHGIDNNAAPNNTFVGNTVHGNVTVGINVEGASSPGSGGATIVNNIVSDNGLLRLVGGGESPTGARGNIRVDSQSLVGTLLDFNLYYLNPANGGFVEVIWGSTSYTSLTSFKAAISGQETSGLESDPVLLSPALIAERPPMAPFNVAINTGDYHLGTGSSAIDSANSNASGAMLNDIEGTRRLDDPTVVDTGTGICSYVDRGAYEYFGFMPTAAEVSVSGRVLTSDGVGIANVIITVWGGDLAFPVSVRTVSFGNFRVDGLRAGHNYIFTVTSRRYIFDEPVRSIFVSDDLSDVYFVADAP